MRRPHGEAGFSVLEVLVAATVLAVAVVGTGYLFVSGEVSVEGDQWEMAATLEASRRIQWLRSLPSDSPDLERGLHFLQGNPVIIDTRGTPSDTSDDLVGYVRWSVISLDDPRNGTGGEDYKLVRVEVARTDDFSEAVGNKVVLETTIGR